VRLRRTLLGVSVLLLVAVAAVKAVSREEAVDTAARAADRLPGVAARVASPSTTSPSPAPTTPPDGQDGSTTTVPPAPAVPQNGTGRIVVVPVPGPQSPARGREVTYTVEVEQGLGVNSSVVARTVRATLLDARGWQKEDGIRFVNISPEQAAAGRHVDIRVTLASPGLTDRLCAPLRTLSQVSCWNEGRSVLNLKRWQLGDDSYGQDVARYRTYQINHEVGHGLGHQHRTCPGQGKRAPIMVQQTLSLGGCVAWPYPTGA
jgi:hypothetical protein